MHIAASPISEGLRPYVTETDLESNAANYPELREPLAPEAAERVAAIRAHLLTVPLLHAFNNPDATDSMREHGLLSNAMSPSKVGATHLLDVSLGLDRYTFMSWGQMVDDKIGSNVLCIEAAGVLLGNTVVTPHDIV